MVKNVSLRTTDLTQSRTARLRAYDQNKNRWSRRFKSLWNLAGTLLLVFVLIFVAVYLLNRFSERSGSIIKIATPAKSDLFTGHMLNGLPVMRLALGKKIEYETNWHYLEGGCATKVHLQFEEQNDSKDDKMRSTISFDFKGRNLPIGAPGIDHLERPQPTGLTAGLWRYTSVLTGECANGRKPPPEIMADFYIDLYNPDQPAFALGGPLEFLTPVVRSNDHLKWLYRLVRNLDGEATIIYTLVSRRIGKSKSGETDLYILQRPAVLKSGVYPDTDVDFDLPDTIHAGNWSIRVSTVTNLPSGRIKTDTLFEENFEVIP